MCDQEEALKKSMKEGVFKVLHSLLSSYTTDLGKEEIVDALLDAIDTSGLRAGVLKEYGAIHFFQNIWLEEPVKVVSYFPYEKKYIRGEDHHVLKFDHDREGQFLSIRQKLEELYRKDNPGHYTDNKVVYVYELKNGRQVAVMFKDGRTVFGNTWDVQDY